MFLSTQKQLFWKKGAFKVQTQWNVESKRMEINFNGLIMHH